MNLRKLNFNLCLFILIGFNYTIFSQNFITGSLVNSTNEPIAFCAMALINAKDSSIVKGNVSDEKGNFTFKSIPTGNYFIKFSNVTFQITLSPILQIDSLSGIKLQPIVLKSESLNLNEVSVVVQKKIVEFKNGNITVNVDGTALSAGNTAYDLLLRLPSVTVEEGNISIQGKGGVKVLIDNKLQQLSGSQLMNTLKSINASQIDKIEVLKKPPVKYDAAGTGGMINILTKKVKLVGFSGSVFTSFSQGFYGNPSGGFLLNYKGKKMNFFSGLSAFSNARRKVLSEERRILFDTLTTTIKQNYIEKEHGHVETFNIGADWFITKNNSIGIKASGALGVGNDDRVSANTISDNSLGYNTLLYNFKKPNPWIYPDFNFNFEHIFDTTSTTLRFSADYSPYYDLYKADFSNHFFDANASEINTPIIFRSANTLIFSILSSKLDFEKQISKSLKLEVGLKNAYQSMLSDFVFENFNTVYGYYQVNNTFTNLFLYKENISAAYLNINKDYKKLFFQLGVRGENTVIDAQSKTNSVKYTRNYFNLFPMLSIEYKKSDSHNFQLSANRRINRPDYNSFNPYKQFRSVLFYSVGNPYLRPEYVTSIDFTYSYKSVMYHTISFSRIDNSFIGFSSQNDTTKEASTSTSNLKKTDVLSYNLFFQKEIKKWWLLNINANVYSIEAVGVLNDLPYSISTIGFNPSIFSRFVLPKKYTIELNAYYLAPVIEGVNTVKSRSSINIGLKRSLFDDKLSLSIAINDLLFTDVYNSSSKYQNLNAIGKYSFDTRRLNISANYNFGKLTVKQREINSNEEEKNRVGH